MLDKDLLTMLTTHVYNSFSELWDSIPRMEKEGWEYKGCTPHEGKIIAFFEREGEK